MYNEFSLNDLLEKGVLWYINRIAFHPRGYALALCIDSEKITGFQIIGNGSIPFTFSEKDDDENFLAFEKLLKSNSMELQNLVNNVDSRREKLDALLMEALSDQELTMNELVKKINDSSYSTRDIKTRVLQLIPSKIELTRKFSLKKKNNGRRPMV